MAEVVEGVDLVILATPIDFFEDLARQLVTAGGSYLVTDVGSVKGAVDSGAGEILAAAGIEFIGSHPMAGSEQCGFEVARSDLFEGASCFLCPSSNSTAEGMTALSDFWESLGCTISKATASAHDEVVARISHLPHVLAAVGAMVSLRNEEEVQLGGGGLRDTTRVAGGDPAMWTGILLENSEAVLEEVNIAIKELETLRDLVGEKDSVDLLEWLSEAKAKRDNLGVAP